MTTKFKPGWVHVVQDADPAHHYIIADPIDQDKIWFGALEGDGAGDDIRCGKVEELGEVEATPLCSLLELTEALDLLAKEKGAI